MPTKGIWRETCLQRASGSSVVPILHGYSREHHYEQADDIFLLGSGMRSWSRDNHNDISMPASHLFSRLNIRIDAFLL